MQLTRIMSKLRGYSSGDLSEKKVLEELDEARPIRLWQAKLSLMKKEDITPSQLKSIAKVINRLTEGETNKLKGLPPDHPLKTFLLEHRQIEKLLRELDGLEINYYEDISPEAEEKLKRITEKLLEIEKHEMREEKYLLPKIEDVAGDEKVISEMIKLINIRHSRLMRKIVRLRNLAQDDNKKCEKIIESRDQLIYSMRDHNFKENRILYPLALDTKKDWSQIKEGSEEIGYMRLDIGD